MGLDRASDAKADKALKMGSNCLGAQVDRCLGPETWKGLPLQFSPEIRCCPRQPGLKSLTLAKRPCRSSTSASASPRHGRHGRHRPAAGDGSKPRRPGTEPRSPARIQIQLIQLIQPSRIKHIAL